MYRDVIDGEKLKKLLPDLPEDLSGVKLEVFVRALSDETVRIEDLLQTIKKRVGRSSYLGKEKEVFFFEEDELVEELRRPLIVKLKELGFSAEHKEGARGTVVVTVNWKNA